MLCYLVRFFIIDRLFICVFAVDDLQATSAMLMAAALKPNTQGTYTSAQNRFVNFCSTFNLPVMPTTEDILLLYIAHLFDSGLKGSSIRVYLSAVRSLHVYRGFQYPTGMLRLQLALKGAMVNQHHQLEIFQLLL